MRSGVVPPKPPFPADRTSLVLSAAQVCEFISKLEASGGGDYPEALEAALHEAADGVTWWPFSTRVVIWVGDAPPHGYQGMGPQQAAELENNLGRARERLLQVRYGGPWGPGPSFTHFLGYCVVGSTFDGIVVVVAGGHLRLWLA